VFPAFLFYGRNELISSSDFALDIRHQSAFRRMADHEEQKRLLVEKVDQESG
jgi:hypothetical protein